MMGRGRLGDENGRGETGEYTLTNAGPACTGPPAMDFTGDCKVDGSDFIVFTQGWLECGLEPAEFCWE